MRCGFRFPRDVVLTASQARHELSTRFLCGESPGTAHIFSFTISYRYTHCNFSERDRETKALATSLFARRSPPNAVTPSENGQVSDSPEDCSNARHLPHRQH